MLCALTIRAGSPSVGHTTIPASRPGTLGGLRSTAIGVGGTTILGVCRAPRRSREAQKHPNCGSTQCERLVLSIKVGVKHCSRFDLAARHQMSVAVKRDRDRSAAEICDLGLVYRAG